MTRSSTHTCLATLQGRRSTDLWLVSATIHPTAPWTACILSICYLTDTEVSKNPNRLAKMYAEFVEGSDLVIVDAMYGFLEYHEKINFGHSTIYNWIDFFKTSDIGELVIFHHDPLADDDSVRSLLGSAVRYKELMAPEATWQLTAAYEGQRWSLG